MVDKKPLCALIVETRLLPNLVEIIWERHFKFLPEGTDLIVYGSSANKHVIKEHFPYATFHDMGNIQMTMANYNRFLINSIFWKSLTNYHRVLIFQHDSRILRKGIEEFYQWDYIGSPWTFQQYGFNGGLSLRNPAIMQHICEKFPYDGIRNEDIHFSNIMQKFPLVYKMAPREEGMKFGVEAVFALGSWGLHAPQKWLPISQVKQILRQYE